MLNWSFQHLLIIDNLKFLFSKPFEIGKSNRALTYLRNVFLSDNTSFGTFLMKFVLDMSMLPFSCNSLDLVSPRGKKRNHIIIY